jgi:hypothetical protein
MLAILLADNSIAVGVRNVFHYQLPNKTYMTSPLTDQQIQEHWLRVERKNLHAF